MLDNNLKIGVVGIPGGWSSEKLADAVVARTGSRILNLATYARQGNVESWNTTINSGGHYAAYEPSAAILEMAEKAQTPFALDFTCVDVVETSEGPMVFEVSAFGGYRGLQDAYSINAAELYTDYVIEQLNESLSGGA